MCWPKTVRVWPAMSVVASGAVPVSAFLISVWTSRMKVSMIQAMSHIADRIDRLNQHVGGAVMWITLLMVLVQVLVVVLRYVFAIGFIPLQESIWFLNGLVFLLGAGFTLQQNGHVRVDIFYRDRDLRSKAWINLAGCVLFLLPFCIFTFTLSLPYVASSWSVFESSREVGGLPGIFLLKSVILIFAVLLGLQALSLAMRSMIELNRPVGS